MAQSVRFSDLSVRGPHADFRVKNVDLAIVNALRRSILAEVQTAAFCFKPDTAENTVEINMNSTVLHNEFMGHRISLVPIHLTEDETSDVAEGKLKYEFHLAAKNTTTLPIDVTSGDITATLNGAPVSKDVLSRMFPDDPVTRDHILIVRLKPGSGGEVQDAEELDATCTLRMGSGKDHARWAPASICTFGNKIDDAKADAVLLEEVAKAREGHASDEEIARVTHDFMSMGRHRCYLVDDHGEPAEFNFKIRTECGLRPAYLVFKGLDVLVRRLVVLSSNVLNALPSDPATPATVTIDTYGTVTGMFQFSIEHEDHTIGNLVQSTLFNKHIRSQDNDATKNDLEYVGYYQPHPLEHRIILRVKVSDKLASGVQRFTSSCIDAVAADIRDIITDWIDFSGLTGVREVDEFRAARLLSTNKPVAKKPKAVAKKS